MIFVIESIRKQIQLYKSDTNLHNSFSLEIGITPFHDWRLDIGEDFIFCNEVYFESHQSEIGNRKRVTSFLRISNFDELKEDSKKELGNTFGYVQRLGEMLTYDVFMKEKLFNDFLNQLNYSKDISLLISIDEENSDKEKVIISEDYDGKHDLWKVDTTSSSNFLNIKYFSLGFILLENKSVD